MGIACLLFFLLARKKRGVILEFISILWFRVAASIFGLYIFHLIAAYFTIQVVVNLFAVACVAILGIPGFIVVIFASIMKSWESFI